LNKGHVIAFLAGAAVGVALSWRTLKKKYERIAQKEINSVKEKFAKRYSKETSEKMTDEEACELYCQYQEEIASYATSATETEEEGGVEYMPKPRVIAPEECGDIEEYDVVSLSLYSDGVLADSITGEPIEDVANTVGCESLHHFGEYEDDSVYVQNDRLKTYYEILMDGREFNHTPKDE
jgi:hypothetical protein